MTDQDEPETIIDSERQEARDAREQELGTEPALWTGWRWVELPDRAELDKDRP